MNMKSKLLLFTGIILLVVGILVRKITAFDVIGLTTIITGVTCKLIYIVSKIKSGEYKPGTELFILATGLLLFFTGQYLKNIDQNLINPIYLIVLGIILKIVFIFRFIQIVRASKKQKGLKTKKHPNFL